jgi:NAD-dependent dihydropyrimidine dehydrogenase PreA subunit/flavodoxin
MGEEVPMSDLRIVLVYFSATHVTKIYAEVIEGELTRRGCKVHLMNVTPYSSRKETLLVDDFDGFIFGFPVFADFAPSVINEWIPTLQGKEKRCAMFFTYGGRTTGYAHFHTKTLLEKVGFLVQFSAEFLGRHSFNVGGWRVLPDRPNEQDFDVAREFAGLVVEQFSHASPRIFELQKPFAYNAVLDLLKNKKRSSERGLRHPIRSTEGCSMCLRCETECPNQAFRADTGLSDPLKCIECMHCVYICPDKVLKIDDRMKDAYHAFLENWHLTEAMMNEKRSKIITTAWQAAF